jgi:hypothetical protein
MQDELVIEADKVGLRQIEISAMWLPRNVQKRGVRLFQGQKPTPKANV